MLSQSNITDKNFTHYEYIENIYDSSYNRDIYLALAVIKKEDKDNLEFPIKLEYFNSNGLIKITTYYTNKKYFNEYFYMGEALTVNQLTDILNDLKFSVTTIDLTKLSSYYGFI